MCAGLLPLLGKVVSCVTAHQPLADILEGEELWIDYGKWYWLKLKPRRLVRHAQA